jgi:iron complex outermembrane receptor protein
MGGVINIVTRPMFFEGGSTTQVNVGAGSYGTVQAEASNSTAFGGRFKTTVAGQYNRSDNHRPNMGFEQYGGMLKLDYDINNVWSARVSGNITHWNASNPGTESQPKLENDQYITRGEVSAMLSNHYGRTSGALSVILTLVAIRLTMAIMLWVVSPRPTSSVRRMPFLASLFTSRPSCSGAIALL